MKDTELKINEEFFKKFKTAAELDTFLHSIFKRGVETMLEAELTDHLGYDKHSPDGINTGNSRNGKNAKLVKTKMGEVTIEVPRDRNGSFNPVLLPKRKRMIDKVEDVVISLYAKGMSTRDIEVQIKELYGINISSSSISNITEQILIDVEEWQRRPLDDTYLIAWMDGITFKVRHEHRIITKTIYIVVGLNTDGCKDVLGMWLNESEKASFWMQILTELKARGVKDILIACTDNLKGLTQAIKAVFPESISQLCIVHQIRNSIRFVPYKHKTEFVRSMRKIYEAINLEDAEIAFTEFEKQWGQKYPYSVKSWATNWTELVGFLTFPLEIRKIIYTTNIIENLNRQIRKYTSNKTMFPDDNAVKKAVYLAIQNSFIRSQQRISNWTIIANQFLILYPDRVKINYLPLRS
jgi:transposase-like protein